MGLLVEVYRTTVLGDCTGGGISSRANTLCLVNIDGPFESKPHAPAAMLLQGNAPGTVKIVPAHYVPRIIAWAPADGWWMMGGNYAATSDSRFSEAIERLLGHKFYGAVAIHDRAE